MKYTNTSIFILMLGLITVKAQVKNDVVIAAERITNILYKGLGNSISVAVPGEKLEDVTILCSGGATAVMKEFGHYSIWTDDCQYEQDILITTFVKGKPRGYTHFIIKHYPLPYPLYGNLLSNKAKLEDILSQNIIKAKLDHDYSIDTTVKYPVTKYTLTIYPINKSDSSSLNTYNVTGPLITTKIKERLQNCTPGDIIEISAIEAMAPGLLGVVRVKENIKITVE